MSTHTEGVLVVGEFYLTPGIGEGKVWIGLQSGCRAGEGGEFDEQKLAEVIRKFYEEHF